MRAMATKGLERWLERLIDDQKLREQFFATPCACIDGAQLSWSELGALLGLPPAYFDEFAKGLMPLPDNLDWNDDSDSDWLSWPVTSH